MSNLYLSDISNPINEHSPAVYMAYLLNHTEIGINAKYRAKVISIKCPVDVYVYNQNGQLLGTIQNNIADEALKASGVFFVVDGDEKYIYAPSGLELHFELIGTDTGEMQYSVTEYDTETGDVTEKNFSNVTLTNGKSMTSTVADDISVPDTQLFIQSDDTITAEIDESGNETDVVLLSFDTDLGDPIRDISVPKGGTAGELPEAHMDGYQFDGWYTDEMLTTPFDSTAALTESATLYAKYTEAYDIYGEFSSIV